MPSFNSLNINPPDSTNQFANTNGGVDAANSAQSATGSLHNTTQGNLQAPRNDSQVATFSETLARVHVMQTGPDLPVVTPQQSMDDQDFNRPVNIISLSGSPDLTVNQPVPADDLVVDPVDSNRLPEQLRDTDPIPQAFVLSGKHGVGLGGNSHSQFDDNKPGAGDRVDSESMTSEQNEGHLRIASPVPVEAFELPSDAATFETAARQGQDSSDAAESSKPSDDIPINRDGRAIATSESVASGQTVLPDQMVPSGQTGSAMTRSDPVRIPGQDQGANPQMGDQWDASKIQGRKPEHSNALSGMTSEPGLTDRVFRSEPAAVDSKAYLSNAHAKTPGQIGVDQGERLPAQGPAVFQGFIKPASAGLEIVEPEIENNFLQSGATQAQSSIDGVNSGVPGKNIPHDMPVIDREIQNLNQDSEKTGIGESVTSLPESGADPVKRQMANERHLTRQDARGFARDEGRAREVSGSTHVPVDHELPTGYSIPVNDSLPPESRAEVGSLVREPDMPADVNFQAASTEIELAQTRFREAATSARFDDTANLGVTKQVLDAVQSTRQFQHFKADGISVVKIELDPPELGAVSVEIKRSEEITRVHIVADHLIAHSLLEKDIGSLLASFRENGEYAMEVEVSHRESGQENHKRNHQASDEIHELESKARRHGWSEESTVDSNPTTGINMIV